MAEFSIGPSLVNSADILVLAGADMPAVLIEVGCLADPIEEKKLQDEAYLKAISEAVRTTITDYFGNNSGISSMDLRQ